MIEHNSAHSYTEGYELDTEELHTAMDAATALRDAGVRDTALLLWVSGVIVVHEKRLRPEQLVMCVGTDIWEAFQLLPEENTDG